MAQQLDRCDIIDVLEESVTLKRPIEVVLRDDNRFRDHVRDVVTEADGEWVEFREHGRVPVSDIAQCVPAEAPAASYDAKT